MPAEQSVNPIMAMVPWILLFVIWYFLLIRPQQKKQKELQEMIKNLKMNDLVVTHSGIHGTVAALNEKTIVLKVDANTRIEFERDAVAAVKKSQTS